MCNINVCRDFTIPRLKKHYTVSKLTSRKRVSAKQLLVGFFIVLDVHDFVKLSEKDKIQRIEEKGCTSFRNWYYNLGTRGKLSVL